MSSEAADAIADGKSEVFDELAQRIWVETRQRVLPHGAGVFAKLCRVAFQELIFAAGVDLNGRRVRKG